MSGRPMDSATQSALEAGVIYPAWIARLDVKDDPVLAWTGLRDLSFYAPYTRKNLLFSSNVLDNGTYWISGLLASRAASGTLDDKPAHKLVPNTTSGQHRNYQQTAVDVVPDNTVVVFSVYLKADGYNFTRILVRDKAGNVHWCYVDLTTGAVSGMTVGVIASGTIDIGGGVWRAWVACNIGAGATLPYCDVRVANAATTANWSGDGTSGVLMAAPMMEAVSPAVINYAPSTYIVSTGATQGSVSEPGQTGDAALDGQTFFGTASVAEVGVVTDSKDGSQAVKLSMPGVGLTDDVLAQLITDSRIWQFRQAWLWIALFDANGVMQGRPIRVKTGRMDQFVHEEDEEEGQVSVEIESHQSYAQEALMTRYSEQKELDPADTSQDYAHDLANKSAAIGAAQAGASGGIISRVAGQVVQRV